MKLVSITASPWGGDYFPPAWAAAFYGERELSFHLWCEESSPLVRHTQPNSPVYLDSCLEVFFKPFPQNREYLNFEMNAAGALLLQIGSEGPGRRFLDPESFPGCYPRVQPFRKVSCWGATLRIPFAFLESVCGQSKPVDPAQIQGNFYKCGEEPPHYLCWSPVESRVPDFHQPEFFSSFAPLWNILDNFD